MAAPSILDQYRFLDRPAPGLYGTFVAVCASLLATAGIGAATVSLDVVVRAPLEVRPITNVSIVKNPSAGPVVVMACSQGALVSPGDLLWRTDTRVAEVDRRNTAVQAARTAVDLDQLTALESSLEAGENRVPPRFGEAFTRAEAYFSQVRRLEGAAVAKKARWEREVRLPPTLVSAQTLRDLEEDWRAAFLEAQRFRAEERERVYSRRTELRTSAEDLERRLAELDRVIGAAAVRAPIGGLVEVARKVNEGDFLMAGEEVVRIVPAGPGNLKLELRIDPRDIVEIHPGQTVRCLFPGLPPSRFGEITGRITLVSADAVVVDGVVSHFLAEAALSRPWTEDRWGRRVDLKPGMVADGRLAVNRKTVLSLLLEKLEYLP